MPSSSLIPKNDPTLLFVNAGMVQFKDVFLGHDKRPYDKAVSVQRCVRAGGKHNDLDNVGYTARHHTFFEMMGNFSFGAYFKREAIRYAWDFVTQHLTLSPDKLWISVYKDDKETRDIWVGEIKINPERISYCGEKDNFWSMGETGPCGPCTEIFYDHGEAVAGGPPGTPEEDGDRYIEIWNIVFMQYNRNADGELAPLPNPSVDTGMGLERVTAILQGVHNNYEIDTFQFLLNALTKLVPCNDTANTSMRVIVDHIRSTSFLIADGVVPSNEGRGYVLRRIMRRALRHANQLGQSEPFFYRLVAPLIEIMGEAYPILNQQRKMIETTIQQEEEQFALTLTKGVKLFNQAIDKLEGTEIPGELVFQLYDTYGFPADLTEDMGRELELTLDWNGFEKAMEARRIQSRQASQFGASLDVTQPTVFKGYEALEIEAVILGLQHEGENVQALKAGQDGIVVLDQTPFYAEGGGQIGDTGTLSFGKARFEVKDTQKQGELYLHFGELESGELTIGEAVLASVNKAKRETTAHNHSATHLLHEALKRVLGDHVEQKGSLVEPARLRFDFSHSKPLTNKEINEIEGLVNKIIKENALIILSEMTLDEAKAKGAIALFDSKYGDKVRVIEFGDFSIELCGGTHVRRVTDIGQFKIINQTGIAAGIRRIEAVTGQGVEHWQAKETEKAQAQAEKVKALEVEKASMTDQEMQAKRLAADLANTAKEISGVKVFVKALDQPFNGKILRNMVDQLKQRLGESSVIVIANVSPDGNKTQQIASVTVKTVSAFDAPALLQKLSDFVGGRGGGRPDFAQGGGDNPAKLTEAVSALEVWIQNQLT